jgi:hypothetical protein
MGNRYIAIGYSNDVPYFLIDFDLEDSTGLVLIDGWDTPMWCYFDKIIPYEER